MCSGAPSAIRVRQSHRTFDSHEIAGAVVLVADRNQVIDREAVLELREAIPVSTAWETKNALVRFSIMAFSQSSGVKSRTAAHLIG